MIAPRTSTARSTDRQATQPIQQFLAKLYGDQPGFMEVGYIHGDPLTEPYKRARWIWYTPERLPEIADYLAQLAQRYGNTYVSSTLYRTKQRNRTVALPSQVIFIDDAPERNDYSLVVRTSERSRHAYYLLDQPVDPATRADLQRRAAHALKADTSGADIEQIVRIPQTVNTKHGGRYPVHLEHISNRTHSLEQLSRRLPDVAHIDNDPASIDWHEVERWLGNRDLIFDPDGIPWRFKNPQAQGRKLLEGKITPVKPDRSGAYDPSLARAWLIKSCILHGYEDAVIAAIALVYGNFGQDSTKSTQRIKADTATLIGKYRKQFPHIKPTPIGAYPAKSAQALPKIEGKSRARKDRPSKLNADGLLRWYHKQIDASGLVFLTRQEAAQTLKISVPTLDRLERQLRQRGELERRTSKDRRRSWIAVLGAINIATPASQPTAESVLSATTEIAHQHAVNPTTDGVIKEHTPPIAPPTPERIERPSLAAAVRVMVDAGAKNRKQLRRLLGEYFPGHPWRPATIDRHYDAERERRKRERLMAQVASMDRPELRKAIRSAEYHMAKSYERENAAWKFWAVYRSQCERRLNQLIAAGKPTRATDTDVPPACLVPEQPELLCVSETVLKRIKVAPTAAPVGLSGGVCFTSSPPEVLSGVPKGGVCQTMHADDPWLLEQRRQLAEAERHNDQARVTWLRWVVEGARVEPSGLAPREAVHAAAQAAECAEGVLA